MSHSPPILEECPGIISNNGIIKIITRAITRLNIARVRNAAKQAKIFDIAGQSEAIGAFHRVDALVGVLDDGIAAVVDPVRVISHPTDHCVDAATAIYPVITRQTTQDIA